MEVSWPLAQDFHAVFGLGENNRYINTVDTALAVKYVDQHNNWLTMYARNILTWQARTQKNGTQIKRI